jgi:uncharacterized protein (DUF1697 family)
VTRYIVLLRGINLGNTRKVPMRELRGLLRAIGFDDARTYIQSGNVLLSSDLPPDAVAARVRSAVEERFGFDVPVLVRSLEEMARVVASDPIPGAAADPPRYYLIFLDGDPAPGALAAIDPGAVAPDRFGVGDRVIYAWYRNGLHVSRLAPMLTDGRLGVAATARNWNTVTRLLELVAGGADDP